MEKLSVRLSLFLSPPWTMNKKGMNEYSFFFQSFSAFLLWSLLISWYYSIHTHHLLLIFLVLYALNSCFTTLIFLKALLNTTIWSQFPLEETNEHEFIQQLFGSRHCVGMLHISLNKPSNKKRVGSTFQGHFLWASAEASLNHQGEANSHDWGFWRLQVLSIR